MKWRLLLWPFSLIYMAVAGLRNLAYSKGIFPSISYDTPLISVGNLSTGGTGKTPMIEYLIRLLKGYNLGMVSRGYGRKTKGLILPGTQSNAEEIGDEPFQILTKFPQVKIAVSEQRAPGIDALLDKHPLHAILLDDAYQHRSVTADLQILLTTFHAPYFRDHVLPAGNLRESSAGKKRADIIILTKCPPDLKRGDAEQLRRKLQLKTDQRVYFSTIIYGEPVNNSGQRLKEGNRVILLSGIAHPETFKQYVSQSFQVQHHLKFPDHHAFNHKDIKKIEELLRSDDDVQILTTEKDWVRLQGLRPEIRDRIFYLPMESRLLFDEEERFAQILLNVIQKLE